MEAVSARSFQQSSESLKTLSALALLKAPSAPWQRLFPKTAEGSCLAHLVLQGGGTLGIAHVGFMHGLEAAGVRFAGLAGTSAGAIVALLAAAARSELGAAVSEELMPHLQSMPSASFIDGPHRVKRLLKAALAGKSLLSAEWIVPAMATARHAGRAFGLNPGTAFELWLTETLRERFGLTTIDELAARLKSIAGQLCSLNLLHPDANPLALLHIVASAMPLGIKFVFPQQMDLLASTYWQRSPALIARASMSVPVFFEPFEFELDRSRWTSYVNDHLVDFYSGETRDDLLLLRSIHFVDGGTLSNFPIDAFLGLELGRALETPEDRRIPTIGAALFSAKPESARRRRNTGLTSLVQHGASLVGAIRRQRDIDGYQLAKLLGGIRDSTERPIVGLTKVELIDVSGYDWLNFNLGRDQMQELFEVGLHHAWRLLTSIR